MAFKILVSPIANNNIDDAIKYYKLQSQSAAKSFKKKLFDVDEKEKIVNILSVFCTHQNPEKYP